MILFLTKWVCILSVIFTDNQIHPVYPTTTNTFIFVLFVGISFRSLHNYLHTLTHFFGLVQRVFDMYYNMGSIVVERLVDWYVLLTLLDFKTALGIRAQKITLAQPAESLAPKTEIGRSDPISFNILYQLYSKGLNAPLKVTRYCTLKVQQQQYLQILSCWTKV